MLNYIKHPAGMLALAVAALVLFAGSSRAEAADRVAIGVSLGGPRYHTPVVERHHSPGYYETRYETVLVEPARYERRWVPDLHETRRDRHGHLVTVCVRHGYWQEYHIPARYETRAVRVWVPGHCHDAPVVAYPQPRPRLNIGAFFKF